MKHGSLKCCLLCYVARAAMLSVIVMLSCCVVLSCAVLWHMKGFIVFHVLMCGTRCSVTGVTGVELCCDVLLFETFKCVG